MPFDGMLTKHYSHLSDCMVLSSKTSHIIGGSVLVCRIRGSTRSSTRRPVITRTVYSVCQYSTTRAR